MVITGILQNNTKTVEHMSMALTAEKRRKREKNSPKLVEHKLPRWFSDAPARESGGEMAGKSSYRTVLLRRRKTHPELVVLLHNYRA